MKPQPEPRTLIIIIIIIAVDNRSWQDGRLLKLLFEFFSKDLQKREDGVGETPYRMVEAIVGVIGLIRVKEGIPYSFRILT